MLKIISGKFRGRQLVTPATKTRPTSGQLREALFNIAAPWMEGSRVLDLFAGSGAIGFEALSRGAAKATFVEHAAQAMSCIRKNIERLSVEQETKLLGLDAQEALVRLGKQKAQFDLIFIDPPYAQTLVEGGSFVLQLLQLIVSYQLLSAQGCCFLEAPQKFAKQLETLCLEGLELRKVRRYGSTLLFEFYWSKANDNT